MKVLNEGQNNLTEGLESLECGGPETLLLLTLLHTVYHAVQGYVRFNKERTSLKCPSSLCFTYCNQLRLLYRQFVTNDC